MPALVNTTVINFFKTRLANDRLAHAYLLIAPKGSGKTVTALGVAQLINCENPSLSPCGTCGACTKIKHGNHPDIIIIPSDEATIKIADIRSLLSRAQLRSYEAKYKVFIIPDAHRMTAEAANAFLKNLEEPAANTLMLLTTHLPGDVLDTIKSRCQWVRVMPDGQQAVLAALLEKGLSATEAKSLTRFASGWHGIADQLNNDGFTKRKDDIIATLFISGLSDEVIKTYAEDQALAGEVLLILSSLIRDAFILKATGDVSLLWHQDALKIVERLSQHTSEELTAILKQAKQITNQINENLNAKMAWQILKERLWNTSYK